MLTILINAYACGPGRGSEPGMAWNWCLNLARYCNLYIITEGEFREDIERVLPSLKQGANM
ncbi:MAG: glycosyltransferase family 1 protein, partial [Prevotellaceae bacterium]|nr:glycosyltransferase family 1 protein [Candidatus Faecinaster equi]